MLAKGIVPMAFEREGVMVEFLRRKALWCASLIVFWTIWFCLPELVVGWYDLTLVWIKLSTWVLSFILPGVQLVSSLLDGWVALIKNATGFFKYYGGVRTELVMRTLAFEGLLFWYQVRLLVWLVPKLPRWVSTGKLRTQTIHP